MTYLEITGSRDGENVVWKEKVTDAVYYSRHQPATKISGGVDAVTRERQVIVTAAAGTASGGGAG